MEDKLRVWNVRDVPDEAINKFVAVVKMQGGKLGDVIGKLMLDYAEKYLKARK